MEKARLVTPPSVRRPPSGTSSARCSATRWPSSPRSSGVWQSVARVVEGERIARFAPGATVMVQVDTTGLPGRNGCPPDQVAERGAAAPRARPRPGRPDDGGRARSGRCGRDPFEAVGRLADDLGLPQRSMGMSDDLEAAVAAGTTMVRIGRALFGERPPRPCEGRCVMGVLWLPAPLASRHYAVPGQEKACHPRS